MEKTEFEKRRTEIENHLADDLSRTTGIELKTEIDNRSGCIFMVKDGKELFGHKVNFYYMSEFGLPGRGEERLKFSMGTIGSFSPCDTIAKMYIAIGNILADDSLQDCIVNSILYFRKLEKEFETLKEACNE